MSSHSPQLDSIDQRLLNSLQGAVPLVQRPFAAVADAISTDGQRVDEAEVIRRVAALRGGGGIIRQISAIFDSRSLGYQGCLVGARVDEVRIEAAAEIINRHPGVSHNYRRDHSYNLWYTVAVPPDSALGLEKTVQILHEQSGSQMTRLMPTIRMYKIGVRFDVSDGGDDRARPAAQADSPAPSARAPAEPFVVTPRDKEMIRVLQQDLPITPRPFDEWASQAGTSVGEVLQAAEHYRQIGVMRRMAAVIRHRKAGFGANAMGAWVVPPDQHDRFGETAVQFDAVSHCYLRPTYEDWPYSIFTMVHGRDRETCEQTLKAIADATGITEYAALYSTHEYKKVRVKYFTDDIYAWERQQMPGRG